MASPSEGNMASPDEHLCHVISHYHSLQSQLSNLVLTITKSDPNNDEVLDQLTAMQGVADGLGSSLSSAVPTKFYNIRRSPDSTTAVKVLHVPELLELILEHNTLIDILNVCQSCHGLKAIIDASSKLQTQLFIRPTGILTDREASVKPHPMVKYEKKWHERGTVFRINDLRTRDGVLYIRFRESYDDQFLELNLGQTWTRMQICQPALTSMKIATTCGGCEHDTGSLVYREGNVLTGKALTFGDLYNKAKYLFYRSPGVPSFCETCDRGLVSEVVFAAFFDV